MKKTLLIASVFFFAFTSYAQSTCETRVDAHQKATTLQRVDYCLHAQNEDALFNPGLVFSGVSSPDMTPPQTQQSRPSARNNTFKPEQVGVSQNFVSTNTFPKVTDGRVSEQEKAAKRNALEEGRKAAQEVVTQNPCELPEEAAQEPSTDKQVQETMSGIRARTHKPGRRQAKFVQEEDSDDEDCGCNATAGKKETPLAEVAASVSQTDAIASMAGDYIPYTSEEEIPVGTASYAPSVSQEIPVGTASYAPSMPQEIPVGTASYAPAGSEEIPLGTASYAPAQ